MGKYYHSQRPSLEHYSYRGEKNPLSVKSLVASGIGIVALAALLTDSVSGLSSYSPSDSDCWQNPIRNPNVLLINNPFGAVDPMAYGFYSGNGHPGIDFGNVPVGTAIYPGYRCGESVVTWINIAPNATTGPGNAVELHHQNGLYTRYYHGENAPSVFVGEHVDGNTAILNLGSTGYTHGNKHLHFEIRVRDNQWLYPIKIWDLNNPYGKGDGFLDPTDYVWRR